MKSCKSVRPLLSAYATKELTPREVVSVDEHLSRCVECREAHQATIKLRSLLALKRHEPPDEFYLRHFLSGVRQRLYSEILERPSIWERISGWFEIPPWSQTVFRGVTAFAAVSALLLSLALWFRQPPHPDSPLANQIQNPSNPNVVYVLDRVPHKTTSSDSSVVTF